MKWWLSIPRRKRFRISIRAIALIVGVAATFLASVLFEENQYWWAIVPTTIILVAALIEFVFGDILTDKRYPARTEAILENYENKIQDVHNQLVLQLTAAIESLTACDRTKVNATIHLAVELFSPHDDSSDHAFVQITAYTGQLGGTRWRFSDVSKGIIGRCFRTHDPEYVNFSAQEEYNERMVREFGFTREEMNRRTMTARSYWAQPMFSGGSFIGVLYLFTTEPQVFPLAADKKALAAVASNVVSILEAATII